MVIRYQTVDNAGHTVVNPYGTFVHSVACSTGNKMRVSPPLRLPWCSNPLDPLFHVEHAAGHRRCVSNYGGPLAGRESHTPQQAVSLRNGQRAYGHVLHEVATPRAGSIRQVP